MNKKFIKIDLSNKFATSRDHATEDGWWQPLDDLEGTEKKFFKKGQKFPLYKGKKSLWRLRERD